MRCTPTIRQEILTSLENKFFVQGSLIMPCIPSLLDYYWTRIKALFEMIEFTKKTETLNEVRKEIILKINEGFQKSPHDKIQINYQSALAPERVVKFNVGPINYSMVAQYKDWLDYRTPPLFGTHPDAKLMAVATSIQKPAQEVPMLDIGAGTGRNTIPLAKLGYPVDAIELVTEFADQIRESANKQKLPVRVIQGNVLDSRQIKLRSAHYQLILISEVTSHFRSVNELRHLLATMSDLLCSGGCLLFNVFLTIGNYEPNQIAREIAESEVSSIFTRSELAWAMDKLPLEIISDESACEYERQHQPIEAWPPTGWYFNWATGRDVFWKSHDRPPIELRWILCRRR